MLWEVKPFSDWKSAQPEAEWHVRQWNRNSSDAKANNRPEEMTESEKINVQPGWNMVSLNQVDGYPDLWVWDGGGGGAAVIYGSHDEYNEFKSIMQSSRGSSGQSQPGAPPGQGLGGAIDALQDADRFVRPGGRLRLPKLG